MKKFPSSSTFHIASRAINPALQAVDGENNRISIVKVRVMKYFLASLADMPKIDGKRMPI